MADFYFLRLDKTVNFEPTADEKNNYQGCIQLLKLCFFYIDVSSNAAIVQKLFCIFVLPNQ